MGPAVVSVTTETDVRQQSPFQGFRGRSVLRALLPGLLRAAPAAHHAEPRLRRDHRRRRPRADQRARRRARLAHQGEPLRRPRVRRRRWSAPTPTTTSRCCASKPKEKLPWVAPGGSERSAGRRAGDRDRQSVRPLEHRHDRRDLGARPLDPHRRPLVLRLHPDRRVDQPGQLGRPAAQRRGPADRRQHRDLPGRAGHRLRGADRRREARRRPAAPARRDRAGVARRRPAGPRPQPARRDGRAARHHAARSSPASSKDGPAERAGPARSDLDHARRRPQDARRPRRLRDRRDRVARPGSRRRGVARGRDRTPHGARRAHHRRGRRRARRAAARAVARARRRRRLPREVGARQERAPPRSASSPATCCSASTDGRSRTPTRCAARCSISRGARARKFVVQRGGGRYHVTVPLS